MGCAGLAIAGGPVIEIPPSTLPSESFFDANPGATVNLNAGGGILAGEFTDPFGFNGATLNVLSGSEAGFFTIDQFIEDVHVVVDGGDVIRTKLVGSVGTTTLTLNSGSCERGFWLMGDTSATQNGGSIGLVAGGQAALIAEDDASFTMNDGTIDTFILFNDDSTFVMNGGTISGGIQLNDSAVATMNAGSIRDGGLMSDTACVFNLAGGTTGDAFVVEKGTINVSGGALGDNSALLNFDGIDPVMHMTSGALGSDFRAYDGTLNIEGGLIGDGFRLGRPTGDGSGVTLNLTVKSATLDGVELMLSTTPTIITARGGEFLSCVMLDDSLVGLDLNEGLVFGEDRIRAGAILTVALSCPADLTGDGSLDFFDVSAFLMAYTEMDPDADFTGDGVFNFFDVSAFLSAYSDGCP
jgi:hypothetical protein